MIKPFFEIVFIISITFFYQLTGGVKPKNNNKIPNSALFSFEQGNNGSLSLKKLIKENLEMTIIFWIKAEACLKCRESFFNDHYLLNMQVENIVIISPPSIATYNWFKRKTKKYNISKQFYEISKKSYKTEKYWKTLNSLHMIIVDRDMKIIFSERIEELRPIQIMDKLNKFASLSKEKN